METNANTGLGLIKTTIERVQNEKSLFTSALKKLVNSSEEELKDFLDRKIEKKINGILRLISGEEVLSLKASNGSRLICGSANTFKSYLDPDFIAWGLNKKGVATPETKIRVHEMVADGNFMAIFKSLPGNWNQKWLSQNQIIDFCEQLPQWLRSDGYATMFLCKIDESKKVDEKNPQKNLVVVGVGVGAGGLRVRVRRLERGSVWFAEYAPRVVAPQLEL